MSDKEHYLPTTRNKVEALIEGGAFRPTALAREIGVSYRTLRRWVAGEAHPQPRAAQTIDDLFKTHVDLLPVLETVKKSSKRNPLSLLRKDDHLREQFFLLVTYHSNAIEGSRMTIAETDKAIHGLPVRGKEQFEIFEAVNHRNALLAVLEAAGPRFRITQDFILKLHSTVMYNAHDKLPGRFRTGHVNLTNADKPLPSAEQVPGKMKGLLKGINRYKPSPLVSIARDHYDFEAIHPFFDGNGRVGRLIMIAQLLSQGYAPAVIRIEDAAAYYYGLGRGDLGDFRPLLQTIAESVLRGYALLARA